MYKITIEQLDPSGNVWRTFTRFDGKDTLTETLDRIERAYNMNHTRYTVEKLNLS